MSLSNNEVNKSIRDTILKTTQNEFSLRNNGITILAKYSSVTDRTGASGEGQLIIGDPQIINGGQTATTLAIIKEENIGEAVFTSKEVLLKIIESPTTTTDQELTQFIESISEATNKQSRIVEADRRSNDPRLIQLQRYFYQNFGLFLERKRGEFQYGIDDKIIKKSQVIDRVDMLRALTAYDGHPERARSSETKIFEEDRFDELLENLEPDRVSKAYFCLTTVEELNKERKKQGLLPITYGKYATLFAASHIIDSYSGDSREKARKSIPKIFDVLPNFESSISKMQHNVRYNTKDGFNFDRYYKGATVAQDVAQFQW